MKRGTFSLENLKNLSHKEGCFDVVICTEVIEHIVAYKKVLRELKRVTKRGGLLILTFPNEPLWTFSRFLLFRRPIKVPDHYNSFSPEQMIKEVGLKVEKRYNIPFDIPACLALTRILAFRK
mgnify:FL=1